MGNFTIENIDFQQAEAEKFWSFPSSYTNERRKTEAHNMIFSGDYLGSLKRDGHYFRFIKSLEGEMVLQGRSRGVAGDFLNKISSVPHLHPYFESLPNGTCLLGEIYLSSGSSSNKITSIMGSLPEKAIERQAKGEKVSYYIFDIWALDGKSLMKTTARERFALISTLPTNEFISLAEYHSGSDLWDYYQEMLAEGEEGIVITKAASTPDPGKRTARKTLKLKKELLDTIDVIIIGANEPTKLYNGKYIEIWEYWYNEANNTRLKGNYYRDFYMGKGVVPVTRAFFHEWAGSLKIGVLRGRVTIQIGSLSGLPDEVLRDWKNYVGKVAEVGAMEIFEDTHSLRHPKFISWRDDLTPYDATYEKAFGK